MKASSNILKISSPVTNEIVGEFKALKTIEMLKWAAIQCGLKVMHSV